ncbi:immune-associated nucleotide-binding protein 3-like [Hypomesus transpacificus]|uniref:immune-associated nucleotide-binding protein 3-like n=1 Tax=Hypomesus transpacificus TaxID=137520 RepID=UPI001F077AD8|nr:immune-associated nucleotide-binding protein 3-like [Hypomesus transpacificus]
MGNRRSRPADTDQMELLHNDELGRNRCLENILFHNIGIVLIGGEGKNTAGNIILGEKKFKFSPTFFQKHHKKIIKEICNRQITLVRTAGSFKHLLHSENQIKTDTVRCIEPPHTHGPHIILLVIRVGTRYSNHLSATTDFLTKRFGPRFWDHAMILFTSGKRLQQCTIDTYIESNNLEDLVNKCQNRYFKLHAKSKSSNDQVESLIEKLEEVIAANEDTHFCLKNETSPEEKEKMAKKIKLKLCKRVSLLKIHVNILLTHKKLESQDPSNQKKFEKEIKLKDAEIARLTNIIEKKDELIQRLTEHVGHVNGQTNRDCPSCKILRKKNEDLTKENEDLTKKIEDLRKEKEQKLVQEQSVTPTIRERPVVPSMKPKKNTEHREIKMSASSPPRSHDIDPRKWTRCLLEILDELNENDMKRFKMYLNSDGIPKGALEKADKETLVDLLPKHFGVKGSVIRTRDALKKVPCNNLEDLLKPFLSKLGESWDGLK